MPSITLSLRVAKLLLLAVMSLLWQFCNTQISLLWHRGYLLLNICPAVTATIDLLDIFVGDRKAASRGRTGRRRKQRRHLSSTHAVLQPAPAVPSPTTSGHHSVRLPARLGNAHSDGNQRHTVATGVSASWL